MFAKVFIHSDLPNIVRFIKDVLSFNEKQPGVKNKLGHHRAILCYGRSTVNKVSVPAITWDNSLFASCMPSGGSGRSTHDTTE